MLRGINIRLCLISATTIIVVCLQTISVGAEWAVAFGSKGGFGWSYGRDQSAGAVGAALGACKQRDTGCQVIGQGPNGCVALARQDGANGYGLARRDSLGGALSAAMVNCTNANPLGCTIKAEFCDRTNGFQEKQTTAEERRALEAAIERGRLNRARRNAAQQQSQNIDQIVQGLMSGVGGVNNQPYYNPGNCRRLVDYNACIRQGATGRGGGGPAFCFRQFC